MNKQPRLYIYAQKPEHAQTIKSWADTNLRQPQKSLVVANWEAINHLMADTPQPMLIYIAKELNEADCLSLRRITLDERSIQVALCSDETSALEAWNIEVAYFMPFPLAANQLKRSFCRYLQMFRDERNFQGIKIRHKGEIHLVKYDDILCISAAGNYSVVRLADGRTVTVTKQIGEMEDLCADSVSLRRVLRSLIVNVARIGKLNPGAIHFIGPAPFEVRLSKGQSQEVRKILSLHFKN